MKQKPQKYLPFGTMPCIVGVLLLSGGLRLGGIGLAIASEPPADALANASESLNECYPGPDKQKLLDDIKIRMSQLDARELELATRSERLQAAEVLIQNNLRNLERAEESLAKTIAQVDGASESDLARLTSVYESMKPKVAAALFEQMDPEFSAGFLGRMNPQAAAGIMSNLSTETGYAISVVLAGRNALAPTE